MPQLFLHACVSFFLVVLSFSGALRGILILIVPFVRHR